MTLGGALLDILRDMILDVKSVIYDLCYLSNVAY